MANERTPFCRSRPLVPVSSTGDPPPVDRTPHRTERQESSMKHPRRRHSLLLIAVAAVAVSALMTGTATSATTSTLQNGRLAFAKQPDEGALFTINPDGTGLARIGKGEFAQFSPDGARLSFACGNGDHVAACVAD